MRTTKRQKWEKKAKEERAEAWENQRKYPRGVQTQYLFQINPLLEVICNWQAQVLALAWEPTRKGRENKLGTPMSQVWSLKLGNPAVYRTNRPQKANPSAVGPTPPKKGTPPPAPWTLGSRSSPQIQMWEPGDSIQNNISSYYFLIAYNMLHTLLTFSYYSSERYCEAGAVAYILQMRK